jgi:hypothetical protein
MTYGESSYAEVAYAEAPIKPAIQPDGLKRQFRQALTELEITGVAAPWLHRWSVVFRRIEHSLGRPGKGGANAVADLKVMHPEGEPYPTKSKDEVAKKHGITRAMVNKALRDERRRKQ